MAMSMVRCHPVCFELKIAPSLTLYLCLHLKFFQLAMGVYVVKTGLFEFNFLNRYISETGLCVLLKPVHFNTFYMK